MLALDVNVLVAALHAGASDHDAMRTWLEEAVNSDEPVGVSDAVLTGAVRVLTHPRVFDPPVPLEDVLSRLEGLLGHPNVHLIHPGQGHWPRFATLCRLAQTRGNIVADAAHAATAMEHNATFITKDRDYARFPGLRWRTPTPPS